MKIGFIGGGNMGSAMIAAVAAKFGAQNIYVHARSKTHELAQKFSVQICNNERMVVQNADIIILATKPNAYEQILQNIADDVSEKIIITIAPNFSIAQVQAVLFASIKYKGNSLKMAQNLNLCDTNSYKFNADVPTNFLKNSEQDLSSLNHKNARKFKIARAMPNTPASIAQGVSALCFGENLSSDEREKVREIFRSFGKVFDLDETKFGAFTAIAGSLPAYVYMFIEAVADGGVMGGIPREQAYEIIAASVAGSANLMLATHKHPAVLKDEVCSPSGTTIEAVKVLESMGFRSALIEAVQACENKANKKL